MTRSRTRIIQGIALLVTALTATACAPGAASSAPTPSSPPVSAPSPTATPEPPAITIDGDPLTGTGRTPTPVPLPLPGDSLRSLTLEVECTGGSSFALELQGNNSDINSMLGGVCEGTTSLPWPLSATGDLALQLEIASETTWRIVPRFSTAEFVVDQAIADDCAAFGPVYSVVFNADIGYSEYDDIDEAEWSRRIDAAAADFDDLAEASKSSLKEAFAAIAVTLRSPDRVAGNALPPPSPVNTEISPACAANQTLPQLTGDYGG